MNRKSTLFLRFAVCSLGVAALLLCLFALPRYAAWFAQDAKQIAGLELFPLAVIWVYAPVLPFCFALLQAFMLLGHIDKGMAFTERPVKALNKIKYSATAMSVLCFAGMPFVYFTAQVEDAPGLIIIAAAFAASPFVIAVFAGVLRRLLQEAVAIKQEHDLTL